MSRYWTTRTNQQLCHQPAEITRITSAEDVSLRHITWDNHTTPHHYRFMALFPDHLGEPVPEENFWTLRCKGRLTEGNTPTILLGATPSGLTSAHLHHPRIFFTGRMPFLPPNQQRQSTEGILGINPQENLPPWSGGLFHVGDNHHNTDQLGFTGPLGQLTVNVGNINDALTLMAEVNDQTEKLEFTQ